MEAAALPAPSPRPDLERLMRPRSVAVVGATDRPDSYGAACLLSLEVIGFRGPVWGVNPRRREVMGHPCVPTVADLPMAVDAIVVAVPAAAVPQVIEDAGARGCGGAVVLSAGFSEAPGGAALGAALVQAAARHGLPVCGPNCDGMVSPARGVALWGDALSAPEPGPVALVSQSGNVAVNALATRRGLRFHTVVASGNQAVLSAADYVEYLAGCEGVGSLALYLEDDGGPRLCEALAGCVEAGVPVAVLKVGRTLAGARAAAAHSGALAGDQRVFESLIREAGAAWAQDVHDLLELAKTLAVGTPRARPGTGGGVAIMTCSGGDSAQAADEAPKVGLGLPAPSPQTARDLAGLLPSAATVANPLDYTAMIWGDEPALAGLVRALGSDPEVDQVLVLYDQPHGLTGAAEASWRAVREGVIAGARLSPVPTLVASTLPELLDDEAAWTFARAGVPAAAGLRTGLRCVAARLRAPADPARLWEIAATAQAVDGGEPGPWLAEHEAKERLRSAGIPVVEGRLVSGEEDALAAWRELGGEVALKVSAPSVQHKTEIGGLALGLRAEREVREAYRRLAALEGEVLAERMAPPGLELILAAHRDGVVPALLLGLGGVWAEVLDDVAVVPLPASAERVLEALGSLRGAPLLLGGRGGEPLDAAAVAHVAAALGELLVRERLDLVECNPVVVHRRGALVLDGLIRARSACVT